MSSCSSVTEFLAGVGTATVLLGAVGLLAVGILLAFDSWDRHHPPRR